MKIGHWMPCYRGQLSYEASHSQARDMDWCGTSGHGLVQWCAKSTNIAKARNCAVRDAMSIECDLLLMQDADCFVASGGGSGMARLYATLTEHDATAAGAVFQLRDRRRMNSEPAKPGEVYEGDVGTGLMLIDLRKLKNIEPAWFRTVLSDDGFKTELGEDIYFCRRLAEHGHRVMVDYTIPTGHVAEDVLPNGQGEATTADGRTATTA